MSVCDVYICLRMCCMCVNVFFFFSFFLMRGTFWLFFVILNYCVCILYTYRMFVKERRTSFVAQNRGQNDRKNNNTVTTYEKKAPLFPSTCT